MNQIIIHFSNLEIQDLPMNQKIHFFSLLMPLFFFFFLTKG